MVQLPGCVPQDVKFKIGCRARVTLFKRLQTRLHDLLRRGQRGLRILRISTRPEFGPDLKTRDLAAGADGAVIVAALNH